MSSDSSSSNKTTNPPNNPMDRFEQAVQACFMGMTKDDRLTNLDSDEIKTDADQTTQNLIESAQAMEAYFLKKKLHIALSKPELIVRDDCTDLRMELLRKDELLRKNYEKLGHWQAILADLQSGSMVGSKMIGNPVGNQTPIGNPGSVGGQQGPLTPGSGRPQTPASVGRPGTPGAAPLTPGGYGRMQPSPNIGYNPMSQGQGPMNQGLQGPLAYLEKTASTIGMNEQR